MLYFSCENLANLDHTTESDPTIVGLFHEGGADDTWYKLGETENIRNNLNPNFIKPFQVSFSFGRNQRIRLEVYDMDPNGKELIGYIEVAMAKIMAANHQVYSATLINEEIKSPGEIKIKVKNWSEPKGKISFNAKAYNLPSKKTMGFFGYDKPFYFIEHSVDPGSNEFIRVIQSDSENGANPKWDKVEYLTNYLCNNDENVNQFCFSML